MMSGEGFGAMLYGMMLVIYILFAVILFQGIDKAAQREQQETVQSE